MSNPSPNLKTPSEASVKGNIVAASPKTGSSKAAQSPIVLAERVQGNLDIALAISKVKKFI